MKKPIVTTKFIITLICIFLLFVLVFMINTCQYIKASQLKIVKDIHSSDSILLQNEFGIDLPPEAEITRLGYCADEIVIRIEGVEDLDSFLTDSLHLELDSEESQELSEDIIKVINSQRDDMYEDMYGTKRIMTFFLNFKSKAICWSSSVVMRGAATPPM